jgi:signal transduction histidine kinase
MQKQTEARMRTIARQESLSRMNEFVSVISHDIKTPLTSIKGNIQLLGRRLRTNQNTDTAQPSEATRKMLAEARELLDRTDQQITRLTMVVNSLLESSHIQSNTMDLLFEICDLNTLISEVAQDKRYVPGERSLHLTLPDDKAILVMGDVSRIKQVVIHYLSNAHKFSDIKHPIELVLIESGKDARVEVHDKGQGISQSAHKHVWERFYRIAEVKILNGSEVGLGLGLHICRTIVERHHGKVGVHSIPNSGSTFWFTLPLLDVSLNNTPLY